MSRISWSSVSISLSPEVPPPFCTIIFTGTCKFRRTNYFQVPNIPVKFCYLRHPAIKAKNQHCGLAVAQFRRFGSLDSQCLGRQRGSLVQSTSNRREKEAWARIAPALNESFELYLDCDWLDWIRWDTFASYSAWDIRPHFWREYRDDIASLSTNLWAIIPSLVGRD